jgi:uncharacterized protein YgiM (DUF1202 family)
MDWINHRIGWMTIVILLALLMGFPLETAGSLRHGDQAVIVTDTPQGTVNIRTIPVQRSGGDWGLGTRLGRAREGQLLKFLEKRDFGNQGIWVRVEDEDGTEAWISGRYLTQTVARDRLIVRPTTVNVRNRASRNSTKIGTVKKGDVLGRVRKQNNWYLAELLGGKRGWVREDMVTLDPLEKAQDPAPAETPPAEPEKPQVDYKAVAEEAAAAGQTDEAIQAYGKALESEPNNGILHFELAKLLAAVDKPDEAIPHFRKAIRGRPPRPEAEFSLNKLTEAQNQAAQPEVETTVDEPAEEEASVIYQAITDNAVYILPAVALGSLAFIGVLVLLYRRRAVRRSAPTFRRRKTDGGFDDVLKYAVEKRPVIREIEEAEKKLTEMDQALKKRFATFREKDDEGRQRLPPGESPERLLKRIDGVRKTVLNQEERARVYADLVSLQNEKIAALDDEIEALKKLIQLDYQDLKSGGVKSKKAAPRPASRQTEGQKSG